ncbi:hydrogenase maturation nickel metallochaperone HypA [Tautonia sociabilis]|uniref:Hydrogenase maturation factor HypA n=1 Tax=Tautonia sociabilis TaxID=2080755 RepID=A0A432MMV1_9BACT|nr:hydrogenase maturation nickel metallochaperone HypA [Tautonia sociabilis]RUL88771.1 hydrogenase maturation nickel metallochaperone HypA [Tautonia sociabilis]
MHELSIAESLISAAVEAIEGGETGTAPVVEEVHLRLGVLAGVEAEALRFCFEVAAEGTPLAGSRLVIEEVPVLIYCSSCRREEQLPGVQGFSCPRCGEPSREIRRGRELELASLHIIDRPAGEPDEGRPRWNLGSSKSGRTS